MADRIDVTNELNQIAISIYGREMRSSIHDGIEKEANGMNEVGNEWDQKVADGDFNATIEVGTVTTGAPGTSVSIVNSGTNAEAVLDFTIPKGDAGSIENATAIDIATSDGSNVQETLDNILIETGSIWSGYGTYYKYANGRLVYIAKIPTTTTITTALGGVFRSTQIDMSTYTYPTTFVEMPIMTMTPFGQGHSGLIWGMTNQNVNTYTALPNICLVAGASDNTSRSYRIMFRIEGRWK